VTKTYCCLRGHQVNLVQHENKMLVRRFSRKILLDMATER
jgi:hypothetical protein